ncbi:MAG TPA: hypothetical protein VGR79_08415 [Stellaceae bacterium]|nr:hypothetical protein [Stellaceae bacterium]
MSLFRRARLGALAAFLILTGPAFADCNLAQAPTTRWRAIEQDSRAWLVDPCGTRTFSLGVNVLDDGLSGAKLNRPHYDWRTHYASLDDWIDATDARLRAWGFNAAGAWSLPPPRLRLPTTIDLELGRLSKFHWFDPFRPDMAAIMDAEAAKLIAPYRHTAYRIGYFSDNEVGWWDGALFTFYSRKPAANFTKQRLVAMLRARYGDDWPRFTRDFVPPPGVDSWASLLTTRGATRLRPGGDGAKAISEWTGIVADHYYALASAAIRKADPEALYFGDRLPIYYDPAAVRAEARYVDVIATNYNVDSPEGWIAPYFFDGLRTLSGGKPVLISEWFYAAHQNRTGNRNNGHLMTVETQAERAVGASTAARNFAAIPDILGLDWFQYYDYPLGGRQDSEDYNFGLVDINDRPYQRLVTALAAANRKLPTLHAAAASMARQGRDAIGVPHAAIDFAKPSLIDWPKPASLLPPLATAAGDVPFGEVYLAWDARGIALATIGQDYYDIGVLAYQDGFPLSEAYRVELDLDAGAGPHRFTLYFIPPKGKTRDYPPMKPLLCAGSPSEQHGSSCPPVAGGRVHYFGADQPRIVADALIPWSALGMSGPPESRRIKLEISARSWFRARWMSLSGETPEAASADPKLWETATLD